MRLAELLDGVAVIKLFSQMFGRMVLTQDVTIRAVQYDSRKVERGDLFVAIRGGATDGHRFIGDAISRGAVVVVVEDDAAVPDTYFMHQNVIKILVSNSRTALAVMAANFYGHPSRRLTVVGVTGTNGKTTTTHLIKSVLEAEGRTVGLIGTIEYKIGGETIPATHTTPESLELNGLLASMADRGCTAAVMEVSSHALALGRVHGLRFRAGVFTNLTQDHLDFHGSMEAYLIAKKILFGGLDARAHAITNVDDSSGLRVVAGTPATVVTYGIDQPALVKADDVVMSVAGMMMTVSQRSGSQRVQSALTGRFNVSNILAAYACGVALGVPGGVIARGIGAVRAVRGRFEQIASPRGWTAIVDYAHTPDALDNCLRTIRELLPGKTSRIITVFGCGGNRDRGKRPIMGRIAGEQSDIIIITSDNPRKEDPEMIIDEILKGVHGPAAVRREPDRRRAIRSALAEAQHGDVVLVAGKGHEDYQVVGDTRVHFDDREEIEALIRENA